MKVVYQVRATRHLYDELVEETQKVFSNLKKAYDFSASWVGRQNKQQSYPTIARKIASERGAALGGHGIALSPEGFEYETGTTYAFIWRSEVE